MFSAKALFRTSLTASRNTWMHLMGLLSGRNYGKGQKGAKKGRKKEDLCPEKNEKPRVCLEHMNLRDQL